MRIIFSANAEGHRNHNLRAGKVDGRTLGRRVHTVLDGSGKVDDRLFYNRRTPGTKSYFVVLMLDISGSTSSHMDLETRLVDAMKSAVRAQAEMLSRLGIPFAVYAHGGYFHSGADDYYLYSGGLAGVDLDIGVIKEAGDPWNDAQRELLDRVKPASYNLDGHALEFARKVAQTSNATDRIILYYTDGAMPEFNDIEETPILKREIQLCRRLGIFLGGVGLQTSSPARHGLPTVVVENGADVHKVVDGLERLLTGQQFDGQSVR